MILFLIIKFLDTPPFYRNWLVCFFLDECLIILRLDCKFSENSCVWNVLFIHSLDPIKTLEILKFSYVYQLFLKHLNNRSRAATALQTLSILRYLEKWPRTHSHSAHASYIVGKRTWKPTRGNSTPEKATPI